MPWRVGGWFRRKELWAERGGGGRTARK